MKGKQPNAEAERKQYERLKVKLQNPRLYKLKQDEGPETSKNVLNEEKGWLHQTHRDSEWYNNGRRSPINLILIYNKTVIY